MNTVPANRLSGKLAAVFVLLVLAAVAAAALLLRPRFESDPPQVNVLPDSGVLGTAPLEIAVTDKGAGLKSVSAALSQGGGELSLASEQFAAPVGEKKLAVALAKVAGVKEGPAVLRVTARDASWWRFFRGNEIVVERPLTIDLTPPTLELVADDRYVNFGGVGVIVYKASPDTATSGVRFGERFFAGFPGQIKDHPDYFLAMFAHAYDVPPDARPVLVATDRAGNTRELRIGYELKDVKYRKSTLAVSDAYLQNKVAPLLADAAARQGPPKDVFVAVNRGLRRANEERIYEITRKATPAMLWQGAFAQLSNSKVEANFADRRSYTYNGEAIDSSYHLGYDLSVTRNYPVEAANSGRVAYTGDLGIYGNTVIVDHGLGLYTLYSHLSAIDVKEGDSVGKRQIVGKTGETGLAAGDHLHYGVYLSGVAVLPVEWWDQKWIDDNITPKLAGASGEQIAKAQQPARAAKAAPKGAGRKRRP